MEENKIIKIREENGKKLVSAREIYEFLESKERFSKWWTKVSSEDDYGFISGVDYTPYQTVHPKNNQEITDYITTMEMAKEISMISKLPKGKEARQYFISCENKLKEVTNSTKQLPIDYISALKALVASEEEKALMQPKVEYYENVLVPNTYVKMVTTTAIAKDLSMTAQALNKELHELKIIYKGKDKGWYLYKEYEDKIPVYCDYIINEHGQTLKWTEKGREWIIGLLNNENLKIAN